MYIHICTYIYLVENKQNAKFWEQRSQRKLRSREWLQGLKIKEKGKKKEKKKVEKYHNNITRTAVPDQHQDSKIKLKVIPGKKKRKA